MPDQPADYPSFRLRLNAILEEDWQAGSLVLSRQGKISRLHYTRSLGMAKSNATPHLDLFERYENLTGSTAPETRPLVIAARKWLEAAMSEGTLELRDDKVSRLQLCRAIGCSAASLRRDEGLILLLSEFDQRVSGMGYLPADVLAKMDELISFLSRSRLLDNDHKSVNQTAAAEAIGLPLSLLKRKPFLPIIQHFDALYMEDVLGDTTTVYLHGRPWKFAGLLRGAWKIGFVEKLAVAFRSLAETRVSGTSKEIYASALSFTEFVADGSRSGAGEMVALLNDGKQPDGVLWENLAFAYRDELYELNQPTTADKKVSSANVLLRGFHDNGIAPLLSCPLGRRRGGRVGNHRPTVVEARTPQTKFSTATHLTDFAAEALQRAASRYEVDLDGADSSGFLATLAQSYEEYGDDVVNNPSFVILDIIKKRLDAIENHAIGIVKRWRDHYDSIAYFLSIANISDKDLDELLRAKETEYRRHVREFFPRPEVNFRLGVGNLVAVARSKFSGLLPSQQFKLDEGRKAFFAKRYLEYGGFENLDAYLRPHNDAVHATLTLYGTASGSNNAVGLTLDHEAIEISDIPGYDRVTGKKARARGKPIIVDLESDGACISAMRWIQEASSPVRDRVESEAERRDLFVVRYGERCQALTAFTHNGWFKEFTSQIPELGGHVYTPGMLRPTVLLRHSLENDGRIRVGMAFGQHGEQVSVGYQQRAPVRMIYDARIRKFQHAFETLVVHSSPEAAALVGRTGEQVEVDVAQLRETGLGTFCKDRFGRPGNDGRPCTSLDCWNDCPQILFIAEPSAVAALQIWQRSLRSCAGDWERDHPERWEAVWLPWLCFADVIEEKMVRGPLIKAWNAGTRHRQRVEALPGFVSPAPW